MAGTCFAIALADLLRRTVEFTMSRLAKRNARTGNHLLDRLPKAVYDQLPLWETISLPRGHELCRQNGPMSHVYFPTSGMCSIVCNTEEGQLVETATVGNEGMIGIPLLLGLDFTPSTAISQVSGTALRMPAQSFLRSIEAVRPLEQLLSRFIAFSLRYAYQMVVCVARHTVEQRLCRWLLTTQDRVGLEEFALTQEVLSELLAVRRQTVTVFARTLQAAGFISYRRGTMRIINRAALEAASCECYGITRKFYDRIVK